MMPAAQPSSATPAATKGVGTKSCGRATWGGGGGDPGGWGRGWGGGGMVVVGGAGGDDDDAVHVEVWVGVGAGAHDFVYSVLREGNLGPVTQGAGVGGGG
jgi:hypothetical protein